MLRALKNSQIAQFITRNQTEYGPVKEPNKPVSLQTPRKSTAMAKKNIKSIPQAHGQFMHTEVL